MTPPVSRDVDFETVPDRSTCLMVWVLSMGEPRVVGQTASGVEVTGWGTQLCGIPRDSRSFTPPSETNSALVLSIVRNSSRMEG